VFLDDALGDREAEAGALPKRVLGLPVALEDVGSASRFRRTSDGDLGLLLARALDAPGEISNRFLAIGRS
jgi:hypothetical protein